MIDPIASLPDVDPKGPVAPPSVKADGSDVFGPPLSAAGGDDVPTPPEVKGPPLPDGLPPGTPVNVIQYYNDPTGGALSEPVEVAGAAETKAEPPLYGPPKPPNVVPYTNDPTGGALSEPFEVEEAAPALYGPPQPPNVVPYTNDPSGGALGEASSAAEGAALLEDLAVAREVVDAVLPDAFVVGVSGPRGGVFNLTSFADGSNTQFGAAGLNKPGQSIVGTLNVDDGDVGGEVGFGLTKKVDIPALANTDALFFINARSDSLPGDLELSDGPLPLPVVEEGETVTLSVNFGGVYSMTDGAVAAAAVVGTSGTGLPPNIAARVGAEAADTVPYDGWAGVAWRATATFDEDGLVSVKVGDTDVPVDKLDDFIGDALTDVQGSLGR
ncbi:MAG: hypothetical protein AAF390_19660 [Pseudomonadota bacterium]